MISKSHSSQVPKVGNPALSCGGSDDKFKHFVNSQIHLYIEINDTADVSCGTVWDALKVYVRGQVIAYVSKPWAISEINRTFFICSRCTLEGYFSSFEYSYQHMSGQICFMQMFVYYHLNNDKYSNEY